MIGAVMKSLDKLHASDTWAMEMPLCFAIVSILFTKSA